MDEVQQGPLVSKPTAFYVIRMQQCIFMTRTLLLAVIDHHLITVPHDKDKQLHQYNHGIFCFSATWTFHCNIKSILDYYPTLHLLMISQIFIHHSRQSKTRTQHEQSHENTNLFFTNKWPRGTTVWQEWHVDVLQMMYVVHLPPIQSNGKPQTSAKQRTTLLRTTVLRSTACLSSWGDSETC